MNSEGDFNQNNDDDDDGVDNPILNEPKSNDDEDDDNIETKCYRRILNATDMEMWIHSEAYRDYLNFIKLLNEFAKGVHNRKFQSRDEVNDEYLCNVIRLLDNLGELCDQIEPINDDKNQRLALFFSTMYHSLVFCSLTLDSVIKLIVYGLMKCYQIFVMN